MEVVNDSYHAMGHCYDSLDGTIEGLTAWPLRTDFAEVTMFSVVTSKS